MMVFRPGDRISVAAGPTGARLIMLGGATLAARATSGGISSPRAASRSRRPRSNGARPTGATAFSTCRPTTATNSFLCRTSRRGCRERRAARAPAPRSCHFPTERSGNQFLSTSISRCKGADAYCRHSTPRSSKSCRSCLRSLAGRRRFSLCMELGTRRGAGMNTFSVTLPPTDTPPTRSASVGMEEARAVAACGVTDSMTTWPTWPVSQRPCPPRQPWSAIRWAASLSKSILKTTRPPQPTCWPAFRPQARGPYSNA